MKGARIADALVNEATLLLAFGLLLLTFAMWGGRGIDTSAKACERQGGQYVRAQVPSGFACIRVP